MPGYIINALVILIAVLGVSLLVYKKVKEAKTGKCSSCGGNCSQCEKNKECKNND